jgi:hypothetical protein
MKAGCGIGSGVCGEIEGGKAWKEANAMKIPEYNPGQVEFLNEIINKRKRLEAGTMYMPQQEQIRQMGAYGMRTASNVSGGDIGGTINALKLINRGTGANLNKLYSGMQEQSMGLMGMEQNQVKQIADRELGLAMYDKQQAMADAAQQKKMAWENLSAGIAKGIVGSEGFEGLLSKVLSGQSSKADLDTLFSDPNFIEELKNNPDLLKQLQNLLGNIQI